MAKSFTIPDELYKEIEQIAKEHKTLPINVIRSFLKLGLVAVKFEKEGGGVFYQISVGDEYLPLHLFGDNTPGFDLPDDIGL